MRLRWTRPVWQTAAMGFQYGFETSYSAWALRNVRSDELEAFAEGRMPSSQHGQCALKAVNFGKSNGVNARVAQMRMHLLSLPQLETR